MDPYYCRKCASNQTGYETTKIILSNYVFIYMPLTYESNRGITPVKEIVIQNKYVISYLYSFIIFREWEFIGGTVHYGRNSGGHYTAILKTSGSTYHSFNDSNVSQIDEQSALAANYTLFLYKRKSDSEGSIKPEQKQLLVDESTNQKNLTGLIAFYNY